MLTNSSAYSADFHCSSCVCSNIFQNSGDTTAIRRAWKYIYNFLAFITDGGLAFPEDCIRDRSMTRSRCSLSPSWVSHSQRFMMSFNFQAVLCFPLGEPLSVFSGCHLMTRSLALSSLVVGEQPKTRNMRSETWKLEAGTQKFGFFVSRLDVELAFFWAPMLGKQANGRRQSSSCNSPGDWAGFLLLLVGITSIEFVENLKGVLFTQLLSRSRNKLLPICYKPGRKLASKTCYVVASKLPADIDVGDDCPWSGSLNPRMIVRRRHVVVVHFPALIVDKPGDPAFRLLPYGYGPVYVVIGVICSRGHMVEPDGSLVDMLQYVLEDGLLGMNSCLGGYGVGVFCR
ncbi:hypothetical protein F2Q69_00015730 [Brassica cretica]|uniref:Uncharacterized protein n=1 Tax=Brassica cretica TaxID=69181 RepID=A0A8S9QZ41_BRACR|nr:hypothetical protein F2Q69_00015730 [Brassica cretica]